MKGKYDYGMIGLGTMGRNLVYNMSDHGYSVAGFDKDLAKVNALQKEAGDRKIYGARTMKEFIGALKKPVTIMMLVPAGKVIDAIIKELKPFLSKNDLLIDCGNSHFTDTEKRTVQLAKEEIHFMGVGVSGGESGARYGPSIMPGGSKKAYKRVSSMLEAVAAKVKGEPCVAYLGPGAAGHYVKMVHNGIEYGLMQLIAEAYQFLKEGAGMNNEELHEVFARWNEGPVQSFLIEITAAIFAEKDDLTENLLIDMILDSARQKGTGAWTSQDAMTLQVPVPVIDTAVAMRDLSAYKKEREAAQLLLRGPNASLEVDKKELVKWLEQALHFAMITTYAQGMVLLHQASAEYKYDLKLDEIAAIWRGGCIIRSSLLEDIRTAFSQQPDLPNLLVNNTFAYELIKLQDDIRKVVKTGVEMGIPLPAMMSSLSYYDGYRRGWLPANLIQAQRDYFGAHTYERTDRMGTFHTSWDQRKS